jgi:hypothetical protein
MNEKERIDGEKDKGGLSDNELEKVQRVVGAAW